MSTVSSFASQLRLNITQEECAIVLDDIASNGMVGITVDHVQQIVWALFGNRFIKSDGERATGFASVLFLAVVTG